MSNISTVDMTEGNITKHLINFSLPVLLGLLFQQFYNIVDTAIVGRILGVDALAAVGATGSVMFLILGFCNGLCSGVGIPISNRFGAKDDRGVRRCVANSYWLCGLVAVVMTLLTAIMCHTILRWMNTPANIMDMSYDYLFIIFCGIPVTILYNLLSSIIRALGDSRTPLYFLVLSSLLNIVLDYVCIVYIHMGTGGAAFATVISQLIAAVLCALYMSRRYAILKLDPAEKKPDMEEMGRLFAAGAPMGLQYSITAIGSLILQTSVNGLGSDYVAAMTSGGKISLFMTCPSDALGTFLATFTGQNMGAGKLKRIDDGLLKCLIAGAIYMILVAVFAEFFGDRLALIFVDKEESDIIANVHLFLRRNSEFYLCLLCVNTFRFVIQGMGFSNLAMLSGLMEMIARGIIGFAFVPRYGFRLAVLASPMAWVMACFFLIPAYLYLRRRVRDRLKLKSSPARG